MKLVIATMGLLVFRVLPQVVELALGLGVCDLLRSHPGQVGAGELLRAGCLARPAVCSALEPATALRGEVGLVLDEALDRLGDLVLVDVSVVIELELVKVEELVGVGWVGQFAGGSGLDLRAHDAGVGLGQRLGLDLAPVGVGLVLRGGVGELLLVLAALGAFGAPLLLHAGQGLLALVAELVGPVVVRLRIVLLGVALVGVVAGLGVAVRLGLRDVTRLSLEPACVAHLERQGPGGVDVAGTEHAVLHQVSPCERVIAKHLACPAGGKLRSATGWAGHPRPTAPTGTPTRQAPSLSASRPAAVGHRCGSGPAHKGQASARTRAACTGSRRTWPARSGAQRRTGAAPGQSSCTETAGHECPSPCTAAQPPRPRCEARRVGNTWRTT